MIKKKCSYCGKKFQTYQSEIKKGGGKYCSRTCWKLDKKGISTNCLECGKEFTPYKSTIKKGGGKYCSRSCYLKSLKTKKPHNFQNNNHVCLWCGRKFHVPLNRERDGRGKYCSKKCLKLAKDSTITRICKGCGKKFSFPKWQDKTCCSLSCNAKWKKIKNKEKNYVQKQCLQCGKKIDVLKTRHAVERGKFCSRECYSKWMSINQVGENSPGWKGGITPFYRSLRTLAIYRKWRTSVLERDQRQCVRCGKKNCLLQVDHIIPLITLLFKNNIRTIAQAKMCPKLWDINNGQSLCRKCHHKKTKQQLEQVIRSSVAYRNKRLLTKLSLVS